MRINETIKTVDDVRRIAQKYYNRGGDVIIECWEDKDIEKFILNSKNPAESLADVIDVFWDQEADAAYYARGEMDEDEYRRMREQETSSGQDEDSIYEDEYLEDDSEEYTSAYNRDYSPSCPWNAPGMCISDFI